jgi:arsenite methyltransferase
MTGEAHSRRRGSYGIDAPYAATFIAVLTVAELVLAILSGKAWVFLPVLFLFAIVASYLYTTLRGKFVVWAELLDKLGLRGDERILDLGCGRGAVLLMAAQCLTTGQAVGIDLWRNFDQSGNSAKATRRNAIAEGVADRIELHTGDMTALPFADNSFDVIVSSLAIHNISGRAGREKAIDEAVRVLRPGGRLMIADVRGTRQHQAQLAKIGMSDVTRRRLEWRFWWGGPWAATRLVTATKPKPATQE